MLKTIADERWVQGSTSTLLEEVLGHEKKIPPKRD
jgi:hypothetical protein